MEVLITYLPAIISTIANGAEMLERWRAASAKAASPGGISDAELAEFAAYMEEALAASQAALR